MKYYITAYDQTDDRLVESIPTTQELFLKVREALGSSFDSYGDCFKITENIYEQLSNSVTLNITKADYFLERVE